MHIPARATTTWFLIVLVTLVSSVGEMLHEIPGCGHAIEMPGGYVLVGVTPADATFPPCAPLPRLGLPHGDSVPCYGEDECPICRILDQSQSNFVIGGFGLALTLLAALPASSSERFDSPPCRPYAARAPPVG